MAAPSIGVAVVGAGMAGRSHAFGYRSATTVFDDRLPAVRLVAIADVNQAFAADAARRYGFERAEPSWEAVAAAPDVDAVSVVVGNALHREVVEGLLAAGKHVLCEKPLADTLEAARAMVGAAERSGLVGAVGYTFRRSPAANAIRERLRPGSLGAPLHFNGRYWCDYGCDPRAPLGHAAVEVGEETEPVDNEDIATFTATFAGGAIGTFSVSRVAFGLPNDLGFELFGETGAAAFDLARPSEFAFCDRVPDAGTGGWRQVLAGPEHPYLGGGLPMAFPGVGHGQNDLFTWQARAFLEQVAGLKGLPPCRSFADGLHTMQVLAGVVESARQDGRAVAVATPERTDR